MRLTQLVARNNSTNFPPPDTQQNLKFDRMYAHSFYAGSKTQQKMN